MSLFSVDQVCEVFVDAFQDDFNLNLRDSREHVNTYPVEVINTSALLRNFNVYTFSSLHPLAKILDSLDLRIIGNSNFSQSSGSTWMINEGLTLP